MNIFVLDERPEISPTLMGDRHVMKMTLEYAQLLCTAHRVIDKPKVENGMYKATHINHPCARWVRKSRCNYLYLYRMFRACALEYTYRFGSNHKSWEQLSEMLKHPPVKLTKTGMTPFALCMPAQYKQDDAVAAYLDYYRNEKEHLLQYTKRVAPPWAPITLYFGD